MLLAIDSSTRNTGIALYDGVQVHYESVWTSGRFHSVELSPAIDLALKQTNTETAALKVIAVAIGPGSYTGLRIGLALAKGLAFSRNLPLVAVPSLDVLAAGQPLQAIPLAAVLQAGRSRLAVAWYEVKKDRWTQTGQAALMTAAELAEQIHKPTYVCGELSEMERAAIGRKYKNAILATPAWSQRRPAVLAELGWQRWQAGDVAGPAGLAPVYLQASDAVPQ